jgi:hypothetical protein
METEEGKNSHDNIFRSGDYELEETGPNIDYCESMENTGQPQDRDISAYEVDRVRDDDSYIEPQYWLLETNGDIFRFSGPFLDKKSSDKEIYDAIMDYLSKDTYYQRHKELFPMHVYDVKKVQCGGNPANTNIVQVSDSRILTKKQFEERMKIKKE